MPGPVSLVLAVNGKVAAEEEVLVKSPVLGRIASVLVVEGQSVALGEPLIRLDDAEARAQVDQAQAALAAGQLREDQARAAAERARALGETISRVARDDAETAFESARSDVVRLQAALLQARSRLDLYQVTAPLAGLVLSRSAEPGQVVDQQTSLLRIADIEPLHVETSVDELYAARMQEGLPALLLAAGETVPRTGTVSYAAPSVDEETGGRLVRIAFNEPANLPVGLTINANITVESYDTALSVPRQALVVDGTEVSVLVIVDETIVDRPIRIIDWPSGRVKVKDGLAAGDAVILDPAAVSIGQSAVGG
jgi:membrane fusion protein, multidrug efflux system